MKTFVEKPVFKMCQKKIIVLEMLCESSIHFLYNGIEQDHM